MTTAALAALRVLYVLFFLLAIDHRLHAAIEFVRFYYGAI